MKHGQDQYKENYKTLMKEIKELLTKWKDSSCNWTGTQYGWDVSSFQPDLQIQYNPNQNPCTIPDGYWQSNSKVYIKRQRAQNRQHNSKKELNWRTDTTNL